MTPRVRRILLLGLVAVGLWTARRVMVDRADKARRRQSWTPERLPGPSPVAMPAATDGPVAALTTGSPVSELDLGALDRATTAATRTSTEAAPTARAEPEPATAHPEAATEAQPEAATAEPAAAVEPEPTAAVEPEPTAAVEPEPAAAVEPEPAAAVEPEPAADPTPPAEGRHHVSNLDEVRERLASIHVDVPTGKVEATAAARARRSRRSEPWREPAEDGTCPARYPVKVKLRSKLYHLPGMLAYDRTNPDRCYRSSAAAEADGFRRAKR